MIFEDMTQRDMDKMVISIKQERKKAIERNDRKTLNFLKILSNDLEQFQGEKYKMAKEKLNKKAKTENKGKKLGAAPATAKRGCGRKSAAVAASKPKNVQAAKKPAPLKGSGKKDVFAGATSIEILPNSIAVTSKTAQSSKGSYSAEEKRTYVEKNDANMKKVNAALNSKQVKRVRVDFKKAK